MAENWWEEAQVYQPNPAQQPGAVRRPGEGQKRRRRAPPSQRQFAPAQPLTAPTAPAPPTEDKWWESAPVAPQQPAQTPPQASPQASPVAPDAPPAANPGFMEQYVNPAVEAVTGAASAVKGAIVGKQDPRFKDIPTLEGTSGHSLIGAPRMAAVTDAALADVWADTLGDRYIDTIKDANGYPIIRYKGKDGSVQMGYVNKPGLDFEDVGRAADAAIPYLGASRLAAMIPGGVLTGMAAQGTAAGLTSGLQDKAAQRIGSKQSLDFNRMALAAAFGAGGELVGRAAAPFIRRIVRSRQLVGPDGKLTERGIRLAKKQGVDPALVDDDLARAIQQNAANASDPAEVLVKSQTDQFGIPTTKGQRTNDPQFLLTEKDIRAGTLGQAPKEALRNLDDAQKNAIEAAARGGDVPFGEITQRKAIAPTIAPNRGIQDQGRDVLGDGVRRGLQAADDKIGQIVDDAWKGTENIAPRAGAFDSMSGIMKRRLGDRVIDPVNTPAANTMTEEIFKFKQGLPSTTSEAVSDVIGQNTTRYIDQMRRRLMTMKDGAQTNSDRAAAKAIYRAYDDWMVDAAEKNLVTGSPGAAQALLNARRTTAEFRSILAPRVNGSKAPAAKILEKLGNAQTGEEALTALLGSSGPKGEVASGAVDAIRRFKAASTKLGGQAGKDAWNDVRLAYWLKTVTGKNGEMLPNGTLITSINTNFSNRTSLMNALYSPKEQKLMKQFAQALKSATPRDPNPSGSGTAIRGMFPNLVKDQLRAEQVRNTFGAKGQRHKILMARIYRGLGKVLPNILDGKNTIGSLAAKRVTTQSLTPKGPPNFAGVAAGTAPTVSKNRDR